MTWDVQSGVYGPIALASYHPCEAAKSLRPQGIEVPVSTITPAYAPTLPVAIEERLANARSARKIGLPW